MPYTLFCIALDGKDLFSVKVDETQTVDELKKAIKEQNAPEFDHLTAFKLTLYRAEVDSSYNRQKRIDELGRLFQNLNECTPLTEEEQLLSELFGGSPPERKKYYILVVPPQSESIDT